MPDARLKLAFVGFRHNHIMGMYHAARASGDIEVVAASEDYPETIDALKREGKVSLTHTNWREVIESVACDAIAVGDYFAKRGEIIIATLKAGKHVISDKPICTRLDELEQIERLSSENRRQVSAQLDLRDGGAFIVARRLIRSGAIGEVHTVNVTAQHPLLLDRRPKWYFEAGKHGGTLNDIAIHATDLIPWMTGRELTEVVAARAWNARFGQIPQFQDAAQFLLKLDNGGGVLGDVSYLAPDGIAYAAPQYWRVTCHGADGLLEAKYMAPTIQLATEADKTMQSIPADPDVQNGRLPSFLRQIRDEAVAGDLSTADVLRATRQALLIQRAADEQRTGVALANGGNSSD
jgi:predicted dehydrogenase